MAYEAATQRLLQRPIRLELFKLGDRTQVVLCRDLFLNRCNTIDWNEFGDELEEEALLFIEPFPNGEFDTLQRLDTLFRHRGMKLHRQVPHKEKRLDITSEFGAQPQISEDLAQFGWIELIEWQQHGMTFPSLAPAA